MGPSRKRMAGYMPAVVKIKEGLYLGSSMASSDLGFLVGNKILGIVNTCAQEVPCRWAGYGIRFSKLYLQEGDGAILDAHTVNSVANFIDSVNRVGNSVLVQSSRGQSRSVAVVAAYLVVRFGLEPRAALEYVHLRRPHARIAPQLIPQVMEMVPRNVSEERADDMGWSPLNGDRGIDGGIISPGQRGRGANDSDGDSSPEGTPRGWGNTSGVDVSTFRNTVRNMEGEDFVLPEVLAARVVEPGTLPNGAAGKEPDYPAGSRRVRRVSWPAERDLCQVAILRSGSLQTAEIGAGEGVSPSKGGVGGDASPTSPASMRNRGSAQRRASVPASKADTLGRQGSPTMAERASQPQGLRSGLVVQAAAAAASSASPAAVAAAVASSGSGPKMVRPGSPAILDGVMLHMHSTASVDGGDGAPNDSGPSRTLPLSPSAMAALRHADARPSSVGSPTSRNDVARANFGERPSSSQGAVDPSSVHGSNTRKNGGHFRAPLVRRQGWVADGDDARGSAMPQQRPAFSPNARRIRSNAGKWSLNSGGSESSAPLRQRFKGLSISTSWSDDDASRAPGSPDMRTASAGSTPTQRPRSVTSDSGFGVQGGVRNSRSWSTASLKDDRSAVNAALALSRRGHSTLMRGTASSLRRVGQKPSTM